MIGGMPRGKYYTEVRTVDMRVVVAVLFFSPKVCRVQSAEINYVYGYSPFALGRIKKKFSFRECFP